MSVFSDFLQRARGDGAFSGAAYAIGRRDAVLDEGVLGTLSWNGPPTDADTLWDLASLTKPIVAIAAMALLERGQMRLDDTIGCLLPDWKQSDKSSITLRDLLTHTSGIPGQQPLFWTVRDADEMLAAVRDLPLRAAAGTSVEYTSQGFMLVGRVLERVSGRPLEALVTELVLRPAGMDSTRFTPEVALRARCAATEHCGWRHRLVQGEVHDENAVVMGGVAGHAGLFSTLGDMIHLCQAMLASGRGAAGRVLSEACVELMTRPHTRRLNLARCLGWQGIDLAASPAGDLFSDQSYGHTGFTGTSVWMDPRRDLFVVLLTNRVHPTRDNEAIHRLRPLFHNLAVAIFGGSPPAR